MPVREEEVKRIEQVYAHYHSDASILAQWSADNQGNRAIVNERTLLLEQMLRRKKFLPLTKRRILDVGCGFGSLLAGLIPWGATAENLYGVDLLPNRIEAAKQQYPEFNFQQSNAEQLNFENSSFDLVILFTVFSSILDPQMSRNVADEIMRVLKPGGAVVWYDFRYRNPNNPHTRPMRLSEIRQLFPTYQLNLQTVTLLPPLARRLGRLTPVLYPLLAKFPPLRTHHLGLITKPS